MELNKSHTLTLDPINAGNAQIIANIHMKAAIITVTRVVRLPVTPVNISYINERKKITFNHLPYTQNQKQFIYRNQSDT